MFFLPGILISILTFPGVIVHELAHQFFCRIFGVAVLDVCYFRLQNPVGYVVHETPTRSSHSLWIGVGPFFVNSVAGALIALPAVVPVFTFGSGTMLDYLLLWLGVSVAMHAIPSVGDAESIWAAVRSSGTSRLTRIVAAPVVGLIYLCALGSFFWLDLFFGVGVAVLVPQALVWMFS